MKNKFVDDPILRDRPRQQFERYIGWHLGNEDVSVESPQRLLSAGARADRDVYQNRMIGHRRNRGVGTLLLKFGRGVGLPDLDQALLFLAEIHHAFILV
jgi:hypothetical protein